MEPLRTIDVQQLWITLGHARMELGVREMRRVRGGYDSGGVEFQIGAGPSTSWVVIRLNGRDLFDVRVEKRRQRRNDPLTVVRSTLGQVEDVYADILAETLIREWCSICDEKGW